MNILAVDTAGKTLGADVHCTAVETAEELEAFLTSWKEAQA